MKANKDVLVHTKNTLNNSRELVKTVKNQNIGGRKSAGVVQVRRTKMAERKGFHKRLRRIHYVTTTQKYINIEIRPTTIGIWDLGAWVDDLNDLISELNHTQKLFHFFEVKSMVPPGLVRRRERVFPWIKSIRNSLQKTHKNMLESYIIDTDFYRLARTVRKNFDLDYLTGITPNKIGYLLNSKIVWNDIYTSHENLALVSTHQLRHHSLRSPKPFKAYLATSILSQILITKFASQIGSHIHPDCLFDIQQDQLSILSIVRNPIKLRGCFYKLDENYHSALHALLDYVHDIRKD